MKIALMSVADIGNYGDILFSFAAREYISRLEPHAEFRFFCPSATTIGDEQFYQYSEEALDAFSPDAIVVVGGEVIHRYDKEVWSEMYDLSSMERLPSDTFWGWLKRKDVFKAWFSVGVLTLPQAPPEIPRQELEHLEYVGVRGLLSKKLLEGRTCFMNLHVDLVPDIGWCFPLLFPDYERQLQSIAKANRLKNLEKDQYIVFNGNWTSIPQEMLPIIHDELQNFKERSGLEVVLLPVGPTRYTVMKTLCPLLDGCTLLEGLNVWEVGSVLCGARYYVGSSLHCAMTALAAGKPAAIIHSAPLTKLQDMFAHMMRPDLLSYDWKHFPDLLHKVYAFSCNERESLRLYSTFMRAELERKFEKLVEMMRQHRQGRLSNS
ncbi:MAG: hypothetical protein BCS36_08805 [Desulfovibrio sp. MES5]|uniref:polysaccharide pyruvyl transferase family protein n=1 Tax=Desulfovibrio sp. MES5 TaxID=1899016 RepID=UPI000B9D1A42|nr:polysaccharide pyruvyl transferase family protein [Desulfovibrio sp. MES5]OXS28838.1 MAG: hypothetical protein BCS36_08805 [Desulfovibrio sp. MES5]